VALAPSGLYLKIPPVIDSLPKRRTQAFGLGAAVVCSSRRGHAARISPVDARWRAGRRACGLTAPHRPGPADAVHRGPRLAPGPRCPSLPTLTGAAQPLLNDFSRAQPAPGDEAAGKAARAADPGGRHMPMRCAWTSAEPVPGRPAGLGGGRQRRWGRVHMSAARRRMRAAVSTVAVSAAISPSPAQAGRALRAGMTLLIWAPARVGRYFWSQAGSASVAS